MKKLMKNLFYLLFLVAAASFVIPGFIALFDRAIQIESDMRRQQEIETMKMAFECQQQRGGEAWTH